MSKKSIFISSLIAITLVSATIITLVLYNMPPVDNGIDDNNDNGDQDEQKETEEEALIRLLLGIYRANTTDQLEPYFSITFKGAISMDRILYILNSFKNHYGEINDVVPRKITSQTYYYDAIMTYGNITGQVGITTKHLINAFYLSLGPFNNDYLISLELEDITTQFFSLSNQDDKSLLITKDGVTLFNQSYDGLQSVASTFKIFVLYALYNNITTDPTINWETEIPILNELKSLPSGEMHTWPAGSVYSLETFARYMIEISDNTATDHLIHFLGRDVVESYLPVSYPLPLLKTSELFKLRYLTSVEDLELYLQMNITEKKAYLSEVVSQLNINDIIYLSKSDVWADIDTHKHLEWFFTISQIEEMLDTVKDFSAMHYNPGVAFEDDWQQVGFKGGSNFGVYSLATSLQSFNSSWYNVIMIVNNYEMPLYENYVELEYEYLILYHLIISHLNKI